jgi:hypothetical protein
VRWGPGRALVAALLLLALCAAAGVAAAQPPPELNPPNDPDFASCEGQDPVTGCKDNEQWDLFGPLPGNDCPAPVTGTRVLPHPDGGLPCWSPLATDPQHAAGIDMTGAWDQGNAGRDDVLIAYIEGGVNYSSDGIKDGLDHVFLNKGELPFPERADGSSAGAYDANGDGIFNIPDYAQDPRVNPACPAGTDPFSKHEEGTTRGCAAGGRHDYLNAVTIGGQKKVAYLSPEDLIAVFGHCRVHDGQLAECPAGGKFDNDGNGYPGDVSGWNFDRNNNDPQTEDVAYNHAPGLISLLGGTPGNKYAGVGVCAHCRVVPVKQGSECLGRTDKWGESILYSADLGATSISSVVVGYTYSSFNQRAIDYAYRKGVVLSLDSNDFDSMDHTDGMLWNHVLPGNSLAEDKGGPAANETTSFRARSNVTSYGTHNIFSGGEYTTSGATPFQAGFLAMVQSAALNARDKGTIPDRLTPNEIKQVLMDTASPVIPQQQSPQTPQQWPGNPDSKTDADHTNWSTQYGYGRPDLGAATKMVMDGKVPPTADMTGPRWFQYVDPEVQPRVAVAGSLAPSRWSSGGSAAWVLEYAPGADPKDSDFITAAHGTANSPVSGRLATLDLTKIPPSFYTHAPGATLQPTGAEQYTLTIRLRVRDANGLKAEDRRSIGLRHDPTLVGGRARYIGAESGLDPTYADLEGRRQLDLVFTTYDGDVHALRPGGRELPGFPVHSDPLRKTDPANPQNSTAPAYRDATLRDVRDPMGGLAVGDLFHDGRLEIAATSTNGDLYAWDSHGRRLRGFPRYQPRGSGWPFPSPTPRSETPHSRLPDRGALAPPALADLEGNGRLDIVMTRYDGKVYAYRPNGRAVPGWPVEVKLPADVMKRDGVDPKQYIRDPKLPLGVGVADVLGTGHPQVFVQSFECNGKSTSTEQLAGVATGTSSPGPDTAQTWLYGIWNDGRRHGGGAFLPHWPVSLPTLSFCYDQSIDFVGEGGMPPVFGDFDKSGKLRVVASGVTGGVYAYNGDGSVFKSLSLDCRSSDCGPNPPYRPSGDTHTITLTGQGGLGDLNGDGTPELVQSTTGIESIVSSLSVPGIATLPQVYEKAWNVADGSVVSGFPRRQDGFPFYDSPVIADVGGGGARQAIEANDNYWVHAYSAAGGEAPGFPKYTGQWVGFSGVLGDPRMDGHLHYATVTREGYLFDWRVKGSPKGNDSWWHYRHDERNSGLFGLDTRRPAAITDLVVRRAGRAALRLTWSAPGDDYLVGRATRYEVRVSSHRITEANWSRAKRIVAGVPRPGRVFARQAMVVRLPAQRVRVRFVAIRAVDEAGNMSALSSRVHAHRRRFTGP